MTVGYFLCIAVSSFVSRCAYSVVRMHLLVDTNVSIEVIISIGKADMVYNIKRVAKQVWSANFIRKSTSKNSRCE